MNMRKKRKAFYTVCMQKNPIKISKTKRINLLRLLFDLVQEYFDN